MSKLLHCLSQVNLLAENTDVGGQKPKRGGVLLQARKAHPGVGQSFD